MGFNILERKLQCQLDGSRIVGGRDSTKVARTKVGADVAPIDAIPYPLRVVPDVKKLCTELKVRSALFAEEEVLEEGNIPVVAARAAHTIMRCVSPGAWRWHAKNGSIKPFLNCMRVDHRAVDIRPVRCIRNDTRNVLTVYSDI